MAVLKKQKEEEEDKAQDMEKLPAEAIKEKRHALAVVELTGDLKEVK
jgi:hypothetical protein